MLSLRWGCTLNLSSISLSRRTCSPKAMFTACSPRWAFLCASVYPGNTTMSCFLACVGKYYSTMQLNPPSDCILHTAYCSIEPAPKAVIMPCTMRCEGSQSWRLPALPQRPLKEASPEDPATCHSPTTCLLFDVHGLDKVVTCAWVSAGEKQQVCEV